MLGRIQPTRRCQRESRATIIGNVSDGVCSVHGQRFLDCHGLSYKATQRQVDSFRFGMHPISEHDFLESSVVDFNVGSRHGTMIHTIERYVYTLHHWLGKIFSNSNNLGDDGNLLKDADLARRIDVVQLDL